MKKNTYNNIFNNKKINGDVSLGAPDPFIYKYNGLYYLICTRHKGLVMMYSNDLIYWEYVNDNGGIVSGDENIIDAFAPELTYFNGYFYIVASPSGNGHYIWRSTDICGPYEKCQDQFNELIDGSFFIDTDGNKYFLRATETGIVSKRFKENDKITSFKLFEDDSFYFDDTIIGNWTEGPFMLKRYGIYYLTYTGTHFLSDAYRVDYSSGNSYKEDGLEYRGTALLSTSNEFYGLGHSMSFVGPNLDSYYIAYHNMSSNGNRFLNISRLVFDEAGNMLVNGVKVKKNPAIQRPDYECYVEKSEFYSEKQFNKKAFSVEFNFKGKNAKLYLSYINGENNQYMKLVNEGIAFIDCENGIEQEILNCKLKGLTNLESFHSIRLQYKNSKIVVYLDNIEIINKANFKVKKGRIGFVNNELPKAYLAYSYYSFGSSDIETIKEGEFFVDNCLKEKDDYKTFFEINDSSRYMIYVYSSKKTMFKDICIDGKKIKESFVTYQDNNLLETIELKKGIHSISFICPRKSKNLKFKIVKCDIEPLINMDNIFEESNVYWRYLLTEDNGIYLENDRNAIISKHKYTNFRMSVLMDLIGNPELVHRFVGLIACCNNYSKSNGFENGYSLQGYMLVLDRKFAYVIDSNYAHFKVLKKCKLNGKRKFELAICKTENDISFYIDNVKIYELSASNKYISGHCGIYNYHASAIFKEYKLEKI